MSCQATPPILRSISNCTMPKRLRFKLLAALALTAAFSPATAVGDPQGVEFFEQKVRPVFVERCYQCHSATSEKLKAGLRLDTAAGLFKGGESGAPAVVPGKLDDSLLVTAIHYEEGGLQMPPKAQLSAQQIADIEAWVAMGAPYPQEVAIAHPTTSPTTKPTAMTLSDGRRFWSFVPPREPVVLQEDGFTAAHNEIDQLILV